MAGFKKAVKHESKLRMALAGPAGSGKTYSALSIATALANGAPVALIDTERGSASKYADLFTFDVLELEPPYHPDRYIAALKEAQEAGYAVLIIDSLTHAWNGAGGLLELHEQVVKRQTTKNSYTAWADVTPIQNRLIDAITGAGLHLIATIRSKSDYVQGQDKRGNMTITKHGTAPIQRDGMEFEFDIFGQMDLTNSLIIEKTRCPALASAVIDKPGADVARILTDWLAGEAAPAATPPAHPAPQPPTAAKSAAPAKATAANWPALRLRMKDALGVTTMADADAICQAACKLTWEQAKAQGKYREVLAEVDVREQTRDAAEADDSGPAPTPTTATAPVTATTADDPDALTRLGAEPLQ